MRKVSGLQAGMLVLATVLCGCSPDLIRKLKALEGPVAGNNGDGGSSSIEKKLEWIPIQPGTATSSMQVDPDGRTIVMTGIPAGRIWDYKIKEDGAAAQGLNCESLPSGVYVEGNRVHVDFGLRLQGGTLSLNCATQKGALSIELQYDASPLLLVTSDLKSLVSGPGMGMYPSQSADGRYVVWQALGATRGYGTQILMADTVTGEFSVISSNSEGAFGNQSSLAPQISADGRYVVFYSSATNLVVGATGIHVYRKDRQTGELLLVSSTDGTAAGQDASHQSYNAMISRDGRYVSFVSYATNFVPGTSGLQIYRKDMQTGAIALVSSADGTAATQANAWIPDFSMSADGRYFAFYSSATSLIGGSSGWQVYRKDLQTQEISLVSSTDGTVANKANNATFLSYLTGQVHVSDDGRYVAFAHKATNLVAGTTGTQVFVKDLAGNTLHLVSSTDGTAANRGDLSSRSPQISADGKYVVFTSSATNLVSGSSQSQIFRKNMETEAIELISSLNGTAATRDTSDTSNFARMSGTGRYVVFQSESSLLSGGGISGGRQIFMKDTQSGALKILSATDQTSISQDDSGGSWTPFVSANGRYVFYSGSSARLFPGTVGTQVFRKDLQTAVLELVSSVDGTAATQDNSGSSYPTSITPDGRYVVFQCNASNLVSGASGSQVYRKDMQTGVLVLVSSLDGTAATQDSTGSSGYAQISSDGRYVTFGSQSPDFVADSVGLQVFRKDLQTGDLALASSTDGTGANSDITGNSWLPQINATGRYVFFRSSATNFIDGTSGMQLYRKDMDSGDIVLVSSLDGTSATQDDAPANGYSVSADGRYVVFESMASVFVTGSVGIQAYRKDLQTGDLILVSSTDGTAAGQDDSGNVFGSQISANGRYVIFTSTGSNLMPGAWGQQTYRKDLQTGAIILVSSGDGTMDTADGGAQNAQMSPDARYVVFPAYTQTMMEGLGGFGSQIYLRDLGP